MRMVPEPDARREKFLNEVLRQIPGVTHTRTFMIMKMYKLSYRWGEAEQRTDQLQE